MTPSLALDYNSRRSNGLLGVGWVVAGFSQITRCARTFVQDGAPSEITFDSSDPFALDGQRLVHIHGQEGGIANGADGAEYRTEQDIHAKIISVDADQYGPGAFVVYTKDGLILTYGGDDSTRLEGNRVTTDSSSYGANAQYNSNQIGFQFVRYAWALSKIEDRFGNYITFAYNLKTAPIQTTGFGYELRPASITYTASKIAGSPPATRQITFNYNETRPDVAQIYKSGFCIILASLLDSMDINYLPPNGSPATLLYRYTFQYDKGNDTGRSRLTGIMCQDGTGYSLGSTGIDWTDTTVAFGDVVANGLAGNTATMLSAVAANGASGSPWIMTGDFAGTGTWDIFCGVDPLPEYEGGSPQPIPLPSAARYTDLDGDGIYEELSATLNGEYLIQFEMGGSIVSQSATTPPLLCATDLTGNGLPDVVVLTSVGSWMYGSPPTLDLAAVWRLDSLGRPTNSPPAPRPWTLAGQPSWQIGGQAYSYLSPVAIDVNGSGKNCLVWDQAVLSDGQDPPSVNVNLSAGVLADLNGDGLQDFVTLPQQGQVIVYINTGNGFINAATVTIPSPFNSSASFALPTGPIQFQITLDGVRALDIDNDGQDELLVMSGFQPANKLFYLKWNGVTLTPIALDIVAGEASGPATSNALFGLGQWRCSQVYKGIIDDSGHLLFQGATDGLPGFVQVVQGNLHVYHQQGRKPDLISQITDGLGAVEIFHYSPICHPSIYEASEKSRYPIRVLTGGMWAVEAHRVDNGSGFRTYEFSYKTAMVDVAGWGWLGFHCRTVVDVLRHATTETFYASKLRFEKWYPYVGLPAHETTTTILAGAEPVLVNKSLEQIQSADYRYGSHDGDTRQTHFPYLVEMRTRVAERSREGEIDLLSEVVTTCKVDAFGNALEVITDTFECEDGTPVGRPARLLVAGEYDNFQTTWLVGQMRRCTRRSVTRSGRSSAQTTAYRYDPPTGALSEVIIEPDDLGRDHWSTHLVTRFRRDAYGLVVEVSQIGSDQRRTSSIQYESSERLFPQVLINALGQSSQQVYASPYGVLISSVDPNGCASNFTYDTFRRVMSVQATGGTNIEVHYLGTWAGGSPLLVTMDWTGAPPGQTSYDRLGRPVQRSLQRFDGQQVFSNLTYDGLGRIITVSLPATATETQVLRTFSWDNLDRIVSIQNASLPPTFFDYKGLTVSRTDPQGNLTYWTMNALGLFVECVEMLAGSAQTTKYRYGPFGRLASVIDPLGHRVFALEYDALGRLSAVTNADSGTTRMTSNAFGEVASRTDATGATVKFTLDGLGRPTAINDGSGTWTLQWDSSPNGIGALALTRNPAGSQTAYSYDSATRLAAVTNTIGGQNYTASFAYDGFGRVSQLTYPSIDATVFAVRYSYNASGYLQGFTNMAGAWLWQCLACDSLGNLTEEQFANGVNGIRTYASLGWTQSIQVNGPAGVIASVNYTYDNNGNVIGRVSVAPSGASLNETFTYDSLNRLATWVGGASSLSYAYDPVGNITTVNVTAGFNPGPTTNAYAQNGAGEHALTTATTMPPGGGAPTVANYGYDNRGYQTSNPNGTTKFTWFGLPSVINGTGATGAVLFEYDPLQKRIAKRGTGWSTIYFPGLYELRTTSAGTQQVWYLKVGGRWLAQVVEQVGSSGSPQVMPLHDDDLGSIVAISAAGGAALGAFSYEPFGARTVSWQAMGAPPLLSAVTKGFTGHEHDDEVGLINMRGRMYDTAIRRFITPDPFVSRPFSSQCYNLYSYVMNNPVSLTDPSGFQDDGEGDGDAAPPPDSLTAQNPPSPPQRSMMTSLRT
jgi:RHS repeat-associated protein